MFPDFIEYDELERLCAFQYYRTLGYRSKRCPYTNKDDAIQGAIVKCWEAHTSYDPDRSKKSTFLLFVARHHYIDLLVYLGAEKRTCPTREVDIDVVGDVAEDHRLIITGKTTTPYLVGDKEREERNALIARLSNEGRSKVYIANRVGISPQHVGRLLKWA